MENSPVFPDIKCGYNICGDTNMHKVYTYSVEFFLNTVDLRSFGFASSKKKFFGAKKTNILVIFFPLYSLYYYLF